MAIIKPGQTAFLKFEIENGNPRRRKAALQDLSRLYRQGQKLRAEDRLAFEKLINGTVLTERDLKVVRWCLNALAQLGTRDGSSDYTVLAMKRHEQHPEIVAAAVAALSRMFNGRLDIVPELGSMDPAILTLAAMQTTDIKRLDVSGLSIDIDKSDAEVLKLALLLVGMNRDFQNLLHPRHNNGEIVRHLGQHDDVIVRQYSVWSVLENRRLTLEHLGIPFSEIQTQPVNVQAKLLQLAAQRELDPKVRHQIIHDGTFSDDPEARIGLAKGVVSIYYEGLEDITLSWYDTESDSNVKALLAEHIARFSDDCGPYGDKAMAILEADASLKKQLLLGSEGTALYGHIKRYEQRAGVPDLFSFASDSASLFPNSKPLTKELPRMKVLFLAASPKNQPSLRLDEEARNMKEQLKLVRDATVTVNIEHAWAIRTDQLQTEVLNNKPDILHFSGHGGPGVLILEDHAGNAFKVPGDAIAGLVALVPSIKCVVLNACYSDSVAKSVAPNVDAVIGCDVSIGDNAAIRFSQAFYRAVAHGRTANDAFALAKNDLQLGGMPGEAAKYKITTKA